MSHPYYLSFMALHAERQTRVLEAIYERLTGTVFPDPLEPFSDAFIEDAFGLTKLKLGAMNKARGRLG